MAENVKSKLLIARGTTDTNVPHSNTMPVVAALIAANKDFDLMLFPNPGPGFGSEPYMTCRRWDYFVRQLLGRRAASSPWCRKDGDTEGTGTPQRIEGQRLSLDLRAELAARKVRIHC